MWNRDYKTRPIKIFDNGFLLSIYFKDNKQELSLGYFQGLALEKAIIKCKGNQMLQK